MKKVYSAPPQTFSYSIDASTSLLANSPQRVAVEEVEGDFETEDDENGYVINSKLQDFSPWDEEW